MDQRRTIEQAVHSIGRRVEIESVRPLSGGCIHAVSLVTLVGGERLVIKMADGEAGGMLREEAQGLAALAATGVVLTPEPLGLWTGGERTALVMTYLTPIPATDAAWRRFGEELAALHAAPAAARYGFEFDNHLGLTPQPNHWCDDWVEFNRLHRLGFQIDRAEAAGLLRPDELAALRRFCDRLDHLLPRRPKPALLHGDLWSGNALPTLGQRVALIDPAPSIGDGWADIAMMHLFGGFPRACFDAYEGLSSDRDGLAERLAVYQLYHLLNHLNLFGRGYAGQVMEIVHRYG